jgi:tetratricopeptide (TPR) repeat protein
MEDPPRRNRDNKNGSDETAAAAAAAASTTPGEDRLVDDASFREDITRLLYRPWPHSEEAIESSLSVIPWKILLRQDTSSSSSTNRKPPAEVTRTTSSFIKTANNTKPSPTALSPLPASKVSFPSISYLDLRRKQNLCFADDQCSKAQQNLDKGSSSAARASWKQALELVPDHLLSLVGYGKFLLQIGRIEQAEELLNEALTIDPKHFLAQTLLSELSETRHQTHWHRPYVAKTMPHYHLLPNHQWDKYNNKFNNPIALTTRKSSAYQDALLERQLLASPPRMDDSAVIASNSEGGLSLVHSDRETDELSLQQRERNRKNKKKERRHRKHKDRRQKKRKRKEHRESQHRKRHSRRSKYYSSNDDSYDDSSSEDSSSRSSSRSKDSSRSRLSAVSTRHSIPKQESSLVIPKKQDDDETNHSKPHEEKRARENEDETDRDEIDDDEGSLVSKRRRKRQRRKKRHDERSHKREPRTKKESSRKRRHHRKRRKRTKNDSTSSSSR